MKHTMTALAAATLAVDMSFGALAATPAAPSSVAPAAVTKAGASAKAHAMRLAPRRVEEIQAALDNNGEHLAVDGIWGPKTTMALRDFQKQHALKASGRPDSQTWKKLNPPSWS